MKYKVGEHSIDCECGCTKLCVSEFNWGEQDVDVEFAFLTNYLGDEKQRWRAAWNVLKGKEPSYAEVLVPKSEAIEFLEATLKMLKENV